LKIALLYSVVSLTLHASWKSPHVLAPDALKASRTFGSADMLPLLMPLRYLLRAISLSVHACCKLESYGKSQSKLNKDCTGVKTFWMEKVLPVFVEAADSAR